MIVKMRSLEPYRHLFPKARVIDKTVKMGATVSDTVDVIPEIVKKTAWQVKKFVQQELSGLPLDEACKKLWWWVKLHIKYKKDERGLEQVRSPRRLIHDGEGDCDCMTTFIHCCLHVLGVKKLIRRITEYDNLGYFQHIYSLVPYRDSVLIMDTVWNDYNKEKKYTKKEDYTMELQFLDGIGEINETLLGIDAQDLFGNDDEMGELGKLLKRKSGDGGSGVFKKKTPEQKAVKKEKRKAIGKKVMKVVNKVNKVNPATVLLRAGILASMKLNVMKIAEKIKWGYATPEYAQSKGMDMSKYEKVKGVLAKTQQIFYASGGNPANLKTAILTGQGNRNREVAGIEGYSEQTSLPQLLGEIYRDEFVNGMEGFAGSDGTQDLEGLGVVTTTAVAAASTAMGTLAALLKSIGDLFPKKKGRNAASVTEQNGEESSESNNETNTSESPSQEPESTDNSQGSTPEEGTDNLPAPVSEETEIAPSEESGEDISENAASEEGTEGIEGLLSGPITGIKNFYQQHKNWIVPVGVVVGIGAVALIVDHYVSKNKEEKPQEKKPDVVSNAINGTGKNKRRQRNKNKNRYRNHKSKHNQGGNKTGQSVIALM